MSAPLELDEQRRSALEQVARRRKVSPRRLLERAVDEFITRAGDEELLESSARTARRTGLRKEDAAALGQKEREKLNRETIRAAKRSELNEDEDIESMIRQIRKKRLAKA